MKLMLKYAVALAVLAAAGTAYAEVPDVSKWSCPGGVTESHPNYGIEVTDCFGSDSEGLYVKISGELVYIHEHRKDANKQVYYNALKTNEGNWVEVVNKIDLVFNAREIENNTIMMSIVDDNGNIVAKRVIPSLQK